MFGVGKSYREIGRRIGRSHNVVMNYLKNKDEYGRKKSSGRRSIISEETRTQLFQDLTNTGDSINTVKNRNNVVASKSAVYRAVKKSGTFVYKQRRKAPCWKEHHTTNRLQWAVNKVTWLDEWKNVFFSDEKKWNLDGPDGCKFYWHDLRNEESFFKSRQFGGGSVMVWAAFSSTTKSKIVFLEGRQNSKNYIDTLKENIKPLLKDGNIFQQDNAPIHVSKETKNFFLRENIAVMD